MSARRKGLIKKEIMLFIGKAKRNIKDDLQFDQYVTTLLHMNISSAIPRNSYMLFKVLKFYLNLVQKNLDLEIAKNFC